MNNSDSTENWEDISFTFNKQHIDTLNDVLHIICQSTKEIIKCQNISIDTFTQKISCHSGFFYFCFVFFFSIFLCVCVSCFFFVFFFFFLLFVCLVGCFFFFFLFFFFFSSISMKYKEIKRLTLQYAQLVINLFLTIGMF